VLGDGQGIYPEWSAVLEEGREEEIPLPLVPRDLDGTHIIMYTSGTTGDPKGVALTGRSLYRTIVESLNVIEVLRSDNFLSVLPLYHILALVVNLILPMYVGCRVTLLDVLDPQRILRTFREEGITIFVCVPQFYYVLQRRILQEVERQKPLLKVIFQQLLRISRFCNERLNLNPGKRFFSKVHAQFGPQFRLFGVGGARFDLEIAESLRDLGFELIQAYGLTETASVATVALANSEDLGSVGKPLPHVNLEIANPDNEGIGEVLLRGESVMEGYYKNAEATNEAIDNDLWFHTGDLGYVSEEGNLYITGRMKDVIVLSSGKNIYPEEIEDFYLMNCQFIKELCVVGVEDTGASTGQERLHAVVVPDFDYLKSQQVVNAYDMIRYLMENLSQQLPSHKRVHSLEIRQEPLPRTTTRKIKRFELERELREGAETKDRAREEEWQPSSELEVEVAEQLRSIKQLENLRPDMNLELDIGLDSLERVEFISNLQERYQVEVTDNQAMELFTLQDVFDLVTTALEAPGSTTGTQKKSWREILEEPLNAEDKFKVWERLRRRSFVEFLFVLTTKVTLALSKVLFRLKGEGLEHLPQEYPFMLCPNHLSYVDAFVVAALLPSRVVKRFFALGYADYFSSGISGYLGQLVKTVPVDADRNLRQALRLAAEGIQQDLVLCVFPEGERSIDGNLKPFRKGPAILSTELKVPVVPVGIRGSYEVWRRGSDKISLRPITVHFGEPITPEPGESADSFNKRLYKAVEELV
jgi:long-chain acyl-CoA synthetase